MDRATARGGHSHSCARAPKREPVAALTEAGIREQVGLVVVGTRGVGGFSGLRLGTTALKVLHQSGLPVVLVPPEAPSPRKNSAYTWSWIGQSWCVTQPDRAAMLHEHLQYYRARVAEYVLRQVQEHPRPSTTLSPTTLCASGR